jgi:hypothetical protein
VSRGYIRVGGRRSFGIAHRSGPEEREELRLMDTIGHWLLTGRAVDVVIPALCRFLV